MALQPPVPYSDFEFSFNDHQLPPFLPDIPQGDLFTEGEASDIFNFLDGFNTAIWDTEPIDPGFQTYNSLASPIHSPVHAPYSNPHLETIPEPSTSTRPRRATRSSSSRTTIHSPISESSSSRGFSYPPSNSSDSSLTPPSAAASPDHVPALTVETQTTAKRGMRTKPLLSSPQKRLNHIMSEQKRRNAIREGYAQLITLLAPAGAGGITLGMPTRGRPKGSGSKSKGKATNKGKSGVLFRAVEYCRWLEEGHDALRNEVKRLEEAAGIKRSSS